jgi:hypothetical protein
MSIDAMKQALEALEELNKVSIGVDAVCLPGEVDTAMEALRFAIEQAEKQEAWKTSDMAYRPEGLPQDFVRHEVDTPDDWSEWVCPDPTQYFMKCCDCGLVHEMQFNIVKYSEGDKCEDFDDPYVQAVFRARRVEQAERQEPVLVNIELSRRMAAVKVSNFYGSIIRDAEKEIERLHGLVLQHITPPQRQPLAYVSGYYAGYCVIEPLNRAMVMPNGMALYTAPPQRKPLTDEQIRELADTHLFYQPEGYEVSGIFNLARAIEAAHGIKQKSEENTQC